jgi:hypothetical protein
MEVDDASCAKWSAPPLVLSGASPEISSSRIRFPSVWFCTCATFSRTSRTHSVMVLPNHHVLVTTRQCIPTAQKIKWPICKRKPPNQNCNSSEGRAVAQAVSRWLPTAAARVRFRTACGVCGGQSGTGAGFLRVLRFPLPIIIPPISPSS